MRLVSVCLDRSFVPARRNSKSVLGGGIVRQASPSSECPRPGSGHPTWRCSTKAVGAVPAATIEMSFTVAQIQEAEQAHFGCFSSRSNGRYVSPSALQWSALQNKRRNMLSRCALDVTSPRKSSKTQEKPDTVLNKGAVGMAMQQNMSAPISPQKRVWSSGRPSAMAAVRIDHLRII